MSSSTTPQLSSAKRSTSRSRPTTPLRPNSRSSLRDGQMYAAGSGSGAQSTVPLETMEPAFAELSDSMADLEANFMQLQLMHESLARFSESFASFLYGLNMNAFCVDFPEAPIPESFRRAKQHEERAGQSEFSEPSSEDFSYIDRLAGAADAADRYRPDYEAETTFLYYNGYFLRRKPSRFLKGFIQVRHASPGRKVERFCDSWHCAWRQPRD
ncbi:MAG: DASH complex subunit dam1 [Piccolia ochrophora]|nr:MAG: DASH complex subunit dam1 [Piccolia ochrophora]